VLPPNFRDVTAEQVGHRGGDRRGDGFAWPILSRIGLGRLPGDIMFQRGGTTSIFLWSPASSSA
jgi:hypothetical protein